jgi:hypothetical protein
MPRVNPVLLTMAALAVCGVAAPAAAQQAGAGPVRQVSTAPKRVEDPKLIFEREIYSYPADGRRDPFKPLGHEGGPLFEDLTLRMIIHSAIPSQSVAVLADGSKKVYRLRRGETLGNATVVDITQTRVVFVVEDYGNRRQEILDLRPDEEREGA